MMFHKIVCIGCVVCFMSSSGGSYEEELYYDGVHGGYPQGHSGNVSSSDETCQQDGMFTSHTKLGGRTVTKTSYLDISRYMAKRQYARAIKDARVNLLGNVQSYSGFFEVERGSYMFFWYFPPLTKYVTSDENTPLIVWVQAAMALPGEFAALRQNGPVRLNPDGKLTFNKYTWAKQAHLIYFDSPVGVGYSFSNKKTYPTNQRQIANQLFAALRQFCDLFEMSGRPIFIAGQSYAGKTITALGVMMHRRKQEYDFNLQGLIIGNGFIDPPNMLEYGKLLYQLGFIDLISRDEFHRARRSIQSLLRKRKPKEAMENYQDYFERGLDKKDGHPAIDEVMGIVSKYNYTQVEKTVNERTLLDTFLNNITNQEALHATGVKFVRTNMEVMKALWPELLRTQVRNFKLLLNNYPVLLYNGQMSLKNAYPLVMNYLKKIKWDGAQNFSEAERSQWLVDGLVAGYVKSGGGVTEVLVRNAGLHVSTDQPKWAQRMVNNFIYGLGMND